MLGLLQVIAFLTALHPHGPLWLLGFCAIGATIVSVTLKHLMTTVLDLVSGPIQTGSGRNTYAGYDSNYTLSPTSVPPVTKQAEFLLTLVGGALTIDLSALTDLPTGAIVDGTGLKVVGFRFKNLGANSMTIVGGAANGYLLFGTAGKIVLPPSGEVSFYTAANTVVAIDATHKTLDVTGTGAQTAQVSVIMG